MAKEFGSFVLSFSGIGVEGRRGRVFAENGRRRERQAAKASWRRELAFADAASVY